MMNNRGSILLQALIAAGIVGTASLTIATLLSQQATRSRALSQKLETLDLKKAIHEAFANASNCSCQLQNLTFDSGAAEPTITLTQMRDGCDPATSNVLVAPGQPVLGSLTGLEVEAVEMIDISAAGNPEEFTANLRITFDADTLAGPLAPVVVPQRFRIDPTSPLGNRRIEQCTGRAPGICRELSADGTPPSYVAQVACDADEYVLHGGGVCAFGGSAFGSPTDRGLPHVNKKQGNGWVIDCFQADGSGEAASRVHVTCCKL